MLLALLCSCKMERKCGAWVSAETALRYSSCRVAIKHLVQHCPAPHDPEKLSSLFWGLSALVWPAEQWQCLPSGWSEPGERICVVWRSSFCRSEGQGVSPEPRQEAGHSGRPTVQSSLLPEALSAAVQAEGSGGLVLGRGVGRHCLQSQGLSQKPEHH